MNDRVSVVLLAAGAGSRMNAEKPKQFLMLGEDQVLEHALNALDGWADEIIVTLPDLAHSENLRTRPTVRYVQGGSTRTDSVSRALREVRNELVLVHDAARPFVPRELLDALAHELKTYASVCPVMPIVNSIVLDENGELAAAPDREHYRDVQTPQGFRTETLRQAIDRHGSEHSHLPELVRRLGHPVKHISGDPWLFKITYEPSLYMAQYYVDHILPTHAGSDE